MNNASTLIKNKPIYPKTLPEFVALANYFDSDTTYLLRFSLIFFQGQGRDAPVSPAITAHGTELGLPEVELDTRFDPFLRRGYGSSGKALWYKQEPSLVISFSPVGPESDAG